MHSFLAHMYFFVRKALCFKRQFCVTLTAEINENKWNGPHPMSCTPMKNTAHVFVSEVLKLHRSINWYIVNHLNYGAPWFSPVVHLECHLQCPGLPRANLASPPSGGARGRPTTARASDRMRHFSSIVTVVFWKREPWVHGSAGSGSPLV